MDPSDFLAQLDALGRWLAEYWASLPSRPVLSPAKPGDLLGKLPEHPPPQPGGSTLWADIRRDLDELIAPGLTHWQHPRFFAYFPANISPPAILGELLSAGLGVQGMLWLTSPACTELETRVLDWTREMLGLPACFDSRPAVNGGGGGGGVIQGTASEAVLSAMVAARDVARKAARSAGSPRPEFTVYASTQAHSSVVKAAMIAGIAESPDDSAHVRLIDVDDGYAMRPELLEAAMREDVARGLVPCFVCATAGTTATTAMDPIGDAAEAIARVRGDSGAPIWLHVDAAHAGSAAVCPEFRDMLAGLDRADSFSFNPHKWLLTNFDLDCFYVRDRKPLINALSVTPEYLRNQATDTGQVIDYRDWQIPLGRRFRALKLWFVIRHYGVEGLQKHVRRTVGLARLFESLVAADPRFELSAPAPLNLVCFRLRGPDELSKRLMDTVNATGRVFLTHAVVPNRSGGTAVSGGTGGGAPGKVLIVRMAVGAPATQEADVREAWDLLRQAASNLLGFSP